MPLSRSNLPAVAGGIRNLVLAIENPADRELMRAIACEEREKETKADYAPTFVVRWAGQKLLALLMPAGIDMSAKGRKDISDSLLDLRQKAKLLQLHDRLSGPFWPGAALQAKEEWIIWLEDILQVLPPPAAQPGEGEKPTPELAPQYVTLDQMAAIVSHHKRTLERRKPRKTDPLPAPDVEGGGGRADAWLWEKVRPWLEAEFGRKLPARYPSTVPG